MRRKRRYASTKWRIDVITIQCKMAEKEDEEKKMLKIMMMMTKFAIL